MAMVDLKMSKDKVQIPTSVETAGADTVRANSQGKPKVRSSCRRGTVKLYFVLNFPDVTFNLVSVCSLRENGHKVLFTKVCVVKSEKRSFVLERVAVECMMFRCVC